MAGGTLRRAEATGGAGARTRQRPPAFRHDVSEAVALADRVLVIEQGRIAHDIKVNIPRPRRRGSADLAALEGSILRELLQSADEPPEL
jgi:hypothetical protein